MGSTQHRAVTTDTDSERALPPLAPRSPGLWLLFTGESIVPQPTFCRLEPGEHRIGRGTECSSGIYLPDDRQASRIHAVVTVSGSSCPVRVRDAGSKNGLYVNGLRCIDAPLQDGDTLRVGSTLLLLRFEQEQRPDADLPLLLGVSSAVRSLRHELGAAAAHGAPVLLLGESGVGKEVSAQALHAASQRQGPLISVNCGAVPDSLFESTFFGHVAGSFTGAQQSRPGLLLTAHRGTLFLDEIGELSPRGQAALLRVFEEGSVTPVGGISPIRFDTRILAATNVELRDAVAAGRFRGDLYARLAGNIIRLPPLRKRREDILLLFASSLVPRQTPLTSRLAEALLLYSYPYNVRELLQMAQSASRHRSDLLDLPLLLPAFRDGQGAEPLQGTAPRSPAHSKQPLSKDVLLRLMDEHQGVIMRVAKAAGRSRRQVMRWLEQYEISSRSYRR